MCDLLERVLRAEHKPNFIELSLREQLLRNDQMPVVYGIEGSEVEADIHDPKN
jgi:hypothetical protein